ncbi:CerR family C-terminal domain-containing protein [Klebsiella sp. I138]|uniref:CerR family C-terminal domain-containing protein n=1 Tax=Klebsiella sp. I138 TaxID=2755385 RepID=UPI003DA84FE1
MTNIAETGRLRHREEGGYSRGEQTRRRLIDVAISLFGKHGYEGASTRDIARQAGVNTPALQYYFDNKEGLYKACADHLMEAAEAHFTPVLDDVEVILNNPQTSREALIEAFLRLQDTIADYLLCDEQAQKRALFLAQEQAGHGGLADPLRSLNKQRVTQVGIALVARLSDCDVDNPQVLLRLITTNGQLMVFHIMPRAAMESMGWQDFSGDNLKMLKETVRTQTRALIDSWKRQD